MLKIFCSLPVGHCIVPGKWKSLLNSDLFILFLTGWIYAVIDVNTGLAQQSTIQGIISDHYSGQVLEGANVILEEIDGERLRGTATDRNGYYRIAGIDPGLYELRVSYIGYISHIDTLLLDRGLQQTISIALSSDEELLDEVVVEYAEGAARRELGRQRITSIDLRRVPTPVAGGDLASYLQTLPGVVAAGDRGGQLFIRGGSPTDNLTLVDGAVIYQPFHIVGFFSAFPEDLISGVDFYPGGFGPRYNDRISSVIDVRLRDGNRNHYAGSGLISPFLADVTFEGPVRKGNSSVIASIRRSLIEETSPHIIGETQPLHFESQFLKWTRFDRDTRCSAMAMRTYDRGRLDFERDDSVRWSNFVIGSRCLVLPEDSNIFLDMNIGISHISNSAGDNRGIGVTSSANRFYLNANITTFYRQIRFEYGGYMNVKWLSYDTRERFYMIQDNDTQSFQTYGAYLETNLPVGDRLKLLPGFAVSIYPTVYSASFEPRLRFSWQPFGREQEEVSGAVGLYRQPLMGISDWRDASSVFIAWMLSPIGESQKEALHALLGWQQVLGAGFQWSVESYYKKLHNHPTTVWSTVAQYQTDLALADGHVYGGDVRLEYRDRILYGFVGYNYSWTEYESAQDHFGIWFGEPVQRFHPPHDRRHQLNALISIDIGSYTTGVLWQFGTGLPYTQPMGFDNHFRYDSDLPNVRNRIGNPRIILDRPYKGRMPLFHRFDFSVERKFQFGSAGTGLIVQAGAINLYNHSNIFYYDVFTDRRIDQLPFSPYLSVKLEYR